jgi:hypothetical protein
MKNFRSIFILISLTLISCGKKESPHESVQDNVLKNKPVKEKENDEDSLPPVDLANFTYFDLYEFDTGSNYFKPIEQKKELKSVDQLKKPKKDAGYYLFKMESWVRTYDRDLKISYSESRITSQSLNSILIPTLIKSEVTYKNIINNNSIPFETDFFAPAFISAKDLKNKSFVKTSSTLDRRSTNLDPVATHFYNHSHFSDFSDYVHKLEKSGYEVKLYSLGNRIYEFRMSYDDWDTTYILNRFLYVYQ